MREAVNRVLEVGPTSGLTDRQFRVLIYLADRLNKGTGQLNPSAGRIARDIGLEPTSGNLSNVRRTMRALKKDGWVERPGGNDGVWDGGGRGRSRPTRLRADLTDPTLQPPKGVTRTPFEDGEAEAERVSERNGKGVTGHRERVSPGHPNLGSRTREEDQNLPSGSTRRVAATHRAATALSSTERRQRLLEAIQEVDPEATWDGETTFTLSNGHQLTRMSHVRAFLESHPAWDGGWPPW